VTIRSWRQFVVDGYLNAVIHKAVVFKHICVTETHVLPLALAKGLGDRLVNKLCWVDGELLGLIRIIRIWIGS